MSDDAASPSLERRLAELEARVAELESSRTVIPPQPVRQPPPQPVMQPLQRRPRPPAPITPPDVRSAWDSFTGSGEGLLGRVGVGLLVVGLILLYRYAVERGWLTPALRIDLGLLLGVGMLTGGVYFFPERRQYRQILMGGGIVVLFVTGLAATSLYSLISANLALLFFIAVAGAAFAIAERQDEAIIATLGGVGALVPPSLILSDHVASSTLWLYLAIVMTWTGILLIHKGWERPLFIAAVLSVLSLVHRVPTGNGPLTAAIVAISACWLVFAALPLLSVLFFKSAKSLSPSLLIVQPLLVTLGLGAIANYLVLPHRDAFTLSTTLDAAGFAIVAFGLRGHRHDDAYVAALIAASGAAAAAIFAGIDAPWSYVVAAAFAVVLIEAAGLLQAEALRMVAHLLFGALGVLFVASLDTIVRRGPFDAYAGVFAIVAMLAAVGAWRLRTTNEEATRFAYLIGVYVIGHVLLASELTALEGAQWLASVSYGLVGTFLIIEGLQRRQVAIQRAGMVSLGLLVMRLFVYDLANVDVGVRIVLFLACGFGFLGLSYVVRMRRFAP